jgi:hypothetical protein
MTSRPLTRLRAQPRPPAGEENTTSQPRETVTGLRHAPTGPLQAPAQPQAGEDSTTGRTLTGPLRARARPQAGEGA